MEQGVKDSFLRLHCVSNFKQSAAGEIHGFRSDGTIVAHASGEGRFQYGKVRIRWNGGSIHRLKRASYALDNVVCRALYNGCALLASGLPNDPNIDLVGDSVANNMRRGLRACKKVR